MRATGHAQANPLALATVIDPAIVGDPVFASLVD
jgi:hypothetical protein